MSRPAKHFYEFGPFRIDAAERLLLRDGQLVPLKPKVFDLLMLLVTNSGHVLGKDELMSQLWPDSFVEEHNLTVGISALRKAVDEGCDGHLYIETVPRRGYRFVVGVREVWHTPDGTNGAEPSGPDRRADAGIAVLPFRPIGAEASELDYLGLGIADALIIKLSNLRQITVRPTSAVRKYTGVEYDPVAAGVELRASSVLDGNIQMSGRRIRVTVQLVRVHDGASLWAEKFDETFTNIFAVEDSISELVVKALTLELSGEERTKLRKRYTENTEAYQSYLKGCYFLDKRDPEGFGKAKEFFEQAIRIDPEYALAHAGLAEYYQLLVTFSLAEPKEAALKAKEATLKALEFDDTLAEAHTSLAVYKAIHEWDWADAEKGFKRAVELNPNYTIARQHYSIYLRLMGRFDEALAEITKAQELDPLSANINTSVASLLYFTRQYERAVEHLLRVLEFDHTHVMAHFYLGWTYEQMGMYEKAIETFQTTVSFAGSVPEFLAGLGHGYAVAGMKGEAREILRKLRTLSKQRYVSPYDIALILAGLGEKERSLDWLEKAYGERSIELALLKVDQRFDNLRADSHFADLMLRVGLTP